jgi:hypothetical protein
MYIQSIPWRIGPTQERVRSLRSWRRQVASVLCVAPFIAIFSAGVAMAAPIILNFEDRQAPVTITADYGTSGVLFPGAAYLRQDPAAHSGTQVLRLLNPEALAEFPPPMPLVIVFRSPQARVKLFGGSQFGSLNGTLTAFDSESGGNVVATSQTQLVPQNTFTTAFEVTVPTPNIRRVEFQLEGTAWVSIDDLEFEGEPPPTPPSSAPVVQITQPLDGAHLDTSRLDITGRVTGEGLLPHVTVTVAFRQPPESTAPPLTLELDLTGSGTTRQFSLPGGFNDPPLGPITITATARNVGGLKGSATSTVTNLPQAIQDRFDEEGGAPILGDFKFGVVAGCKVAVYERGAISASADERAKVIRGDIFPKWLSLRTAFSGNGIGCPLNEEGDAMAGARVQRFERGRIYARLPHIASPATAYVPTVFASVIDNRGGEAGVGLPLADPADSIGVMQTWLFQQFVRPDRAAAGKPPLLPSTLEIRGTPPTLWLERQGGDWLLFDPSDPDSRASALEPSLFEMSVKCNDGTPCPKSAATIWESFPCSDNLGPCTVGLEPTLPQPNPDAGAVCGNRTWPLGPPEWVALRGDYFATPFFGVITWAKMADIDNGVTHETHNGNCPYLGESLAIGSALFPLGTDILYGSYVAAEEYGLTCGSDYEFAMRPIGRQFDPSPLPSLYGYGGEDEKQGEMKTEYEAYYASAAHNFLGAPANGDVVHITGRWIVDCGHGKYKSELHPLFSFARMKTVVSETNLFTGLEERLFGEKPATRVAIWINGWYPGGDNNAIELDAFPPPRPSPNAVLHVVKPVDFAPGGYRAAEGVNLNFALVPAGTANHVHLRFTSPLRQNVVTGAGEMMFEPGRQYWGIWYLYWGQ